MFGRKKRSLSDGAGELRAQVSRTQVTTATLDTSPAPPVSEEAELTALAPSARDLQSTLDASEAELAAVLADLGTSASERIGHPVEILPFLMLPAECWDSDHQRVLIETLELTPTQTWNVLPLGATPADAAAIGVAQHPLVVNAALIEQCQGFVDDIVTTMLTSFERATFGGDTVDTDALAVARHQARADIMGLARTAAAMELGDETVAKAREVFFQD